ncbi:MAG: iron-containing alcohol dehydrogenase [Treponema sp.]|nr:iron-containing alcohol dehydrogenase [Treponema sp.]
MDNSFKFDPEVLIGADTLSMAGTIAGRYGGRMMIAADHRLESQVVNRLKETLEDSGLEAIVFDGIEENSSVEMAENIVELSRAAHCDVIIGFGGENTQTIARMAAIMAPMRITAFELLDGRNLQNKFLPFLSIPTEGAGVFSAINYFLAADPRNKFIKSIPSPDKLYASIIIDSNQFKFLSENNAMAFVLEGFFSAVEAYCSTRANFLSDAILERALNFFAKLLKTGTGTINAETFAQASFLTALGSSVSSPGIGAALSAAISARCSIQKPLCSAALFPVIAERLVGARPEKMARVASFLGNAKAASVAEAAASSVDGIRRIMGAVNVPASLAEHNIPLDRLTAAVEAARNLELTANSPWTVSEEEVFKILKQIL